MARMMLPQAIRPSTALPGVSDLRDENVYSACVVQHNGATSAKLFTVPQGQGIPSIKGSSINASTQAHHTLYTDLTTNLEKAGEFGNNLGDAGVRAIGITLESAGWTTTLDSTPGYTRRAYGLAAADALEVLYKCTLEFKVSSNRQIIGPAWAFPQTGAPMGSIGVSQNVTAGAAVGTIDGLVQNASLPLGRKLRVPVMIARNDVVVCEFKVGPAALTFSKSTADGQPALVWVNLLATIKGDVR